jgi:hypothetical protein
MMRTFALALAAVAVAADSRPWMNKADPAGVRAKKLVAEMKMEEKLVMLHGPIAPMPCCECFNKTTGKIVDKACAYTGNVVPNERLGIPPIHMHDGPQGFRENMWPGTTTAWPSSLTVGASWDPEAAGKWGCVARAAAGRVGRPRWLTSTALCAACCSQRRHGQGILCEGRQRPARPRRVPRARAAERPEF